ncbi:MAG: hypothetical protein J7502_16775 [Flavisolibacter sp.]|nr:hypothetical protein [Flavisolibacter sp.]
MQICFKEVLLLIPPVYLYTVWMLLCLMVLVSFLVYRYQKNKKQNDTVIVEERHVGGEVEAASEIMVETTDSVGPLVAVETSKAADVRMVRPEEEVQALFHAFVHGWLERSGFYTTDAGAPGSEGTVHYFVQGSDGIVSMAVVSRWKEGLIKGRVEWARSYELVRYRQFEKNEGIPVYIAVGVGGHPEEPAMLAFIPLKKVRSNVLSQIQVEAHAIPFEVGPELN